MDNFLTSLPISKVVRSFDISISRQGHQEGEAGRYNDPGAHGLQEGRWLQCPLSSRGAHRYDTEKSACEA